MLTVSSLNINPEQLTGLTLQEALGKIPSTVNIRVMRPGHIYTADFVANRLNLIIDEKEKITRANWC